MKAASHSLTRLLILMFNDNDLTSLFKSHVVATQAEITTGIPMHPGVRVAYLITNRDNLDLLHEAVGELHLNVPYALCLDHDSVDDLTHLHNSVAFLSCDASPNSWCAVQAKSEGLPSIIGLQGSIGVDAYQMQERAIELIGKANSLIAVTLKPGHIDIYKDGRAKPSRIHDGELITIDGSAGRIYAGECGAKNAILPELYKVLTDVVIDSLSQHGPKTGWHLFDQTELYQIHKGRIKELLQDNRVSQVLRSVSELPTDHRPQVAGTVHTVSGVVQARLAGCSIRWDQQKDRLVIDLKAGNFGIGLLRTERIFTRKPELNDLRVITLGQTVFSRKEIDAALKRFMVFVEDEYKQLMLANLGGLSVTRTLCMPNNKLFPPDLDIEHFSREHDKNLKNIKLILKTNINESETFHGTRGTRLHMINEKLARAEIRAYLNAIIAVRKRDDKQRFVLLMSMVTLPTEVIKFSEWINEIAQEIRSDGEHVPFVELAIMVETSGAYLLLERFCSISNDSCALTGFFFGGNDFTAAVLNMNRADSVKNLIPAYQKLGLFEHNPFIRLNKLVIETIAEGARRIRRVLGHRAIIGFGGEQAADYWSIRMLEKASGNRIDFVSTSPDRIHEHYVCMTHFK